MLKLAEFLTKLQQLKQPQKYSNFIAQELQRIKISFQKNQKKYRARNMAKLLYIKMDSSFYQTNFAYQQPLQLIKSEYLIERRIGYLALTQHQTLKTMEVAIQTIKSHLASTNLQNIILSLSALSNIIQKYPTYFDNFKKQINLLLNYDNAQIQKKSLLLASQVIKINPKAYLNKFYDSVIRKIDSKKQYLFKQILLFLTIVAQNKAYLKHQTMLQHMHQIIFSMYYSIQNKIYSFQKENRHITIVQKSLISERFMKFLKVNASKALVEFFLNNHPLLSYSTQNNQMQNQSFSEQFFQFSNLLNLSISYTQSKFIKEKIIFILQNLKKLSKLNSNYQLLLLSALQKMNLNLRYQIFDKYNLMEFYTNENEDIKRKSIILLYQDFILRQNYSRKNVQNFRIIIKTLDQLESQQILIKGYYTTQFKQIVLKQNGYIQVNAQNNWDINTKNQILNSSHKFLFLKLLHNLISNSQESFYHQSEKLFESKLIRSVFPFIKQNYFQQKKTKAFQLWNQTNGIYNEKDESFQHLLSNKQNQRKNQIVKPIKIEIALSDNGFTEIQLGNSRLLQVLFYSGFDNRNDSNFKNVTQRQIAWQLNPEGIVSIDMYGRLLSLKTGNVQITVKSLANDVQDTKRVCVVDPKLKKIKKIHTIIKKYQGDQEDEVQNFQKIVQRFLHKEIQINQKIPNRIKKIHSQKLIKTKISKGSVVWTVQNFADGQPGSYVKRVDNSLQQSNRDKHQYFMGDRYLPQDGKSPVSIQFDEQNGIWVISNNGDINHIKMVKMSYFSKALMMSKDTQKNVLRHGVASGSNWNGSRWVPYIADNDGLWSSMYGSGQIMRYSALKKAGASSSVIKQARTSALRTLKAVLLIGCISGRQGTVDTKFRYLTNTRLGDGYWGSDVYLKQGKCYSVDSYVGAPSQGIGFYGIDAGKTTQGHYIGGQLKYTIQGIKKEDWTKTQKAAYSKRTLHGFISRAFLIRGIQTPPGGLFFQRNQDGTQTVLSSADTLYDFGPNDHPILKIGNKAIPDVLKDVIFVNGKQYQEKDIIYKGDTSADQIIGHLFIYKIGFDVMDEKDPQQKAVKKVIVDVVTNFSQHILDNGFTLVDATGQGTKWGKTGRQFINSDASIQEGNMLGLILLMTFKLAYYMTGQKRWQDQYLFLINHKSFRYLDFAQSYWDHWMYIGYNQDQSPQHNIYRLRKQDKPSQVQQKAHAMYSIHYSDEQMAMMVFYLCFQLQTDSQLLKKYQKAVDGWWISVSHSENPLWYYIYQLSKPKQTVLDAYGNNILKTASWQLSRHPIETVTRKAYFDGSRSDVLLDFKFSVDPKKIIGRRTCKTDTQNASNRSNYKIDPSYDAKNIHMIKVLPADQRSLHKMNGTTFDRISSSNSNGMQPATTYTLPYWFGVYHGMLKFNNK